MTMDKAAIKAELDADTRNISGLWNSAVQAYNATTGIPLAEPHFKDSQEMIRFGQEGAEQFQSWRHGDKRVDKLRSLFMQNITFIEAGAKQLVAAASASFPPAAAIGTAMTLVLSGCKGQKADYDAVVNFFEDMNNFLQRVTIIEKRVPRKRAYQNALMDVFSSLLHMCAVAHKFIALGRFKKWAINTVLGGDSELAGGRAKMDTSMKRLQSATEFAILDNSENLLEKQDVLGNSLAAFQQELRRNQTVQDRLAQSQALALEGISSGIGDLSSDLQDIKRLLLSRNERASQEGPTNEASEVSVSANPLRALLADFLPERDAMTVLSDLRQTRIPGTGKWIFEDSTWLEWIKSSSPQIAIQGSRGIGKTQLSVAVYEHFVDCTQEEVGSHTCAVYFQLTSTNNTSSYMLTALAAFALQLVDQNAAIRQQLFQQIQDEEALMVFYENFGKEDTNWDFFLLNFFKASSDHRLFMIFDGIDELAEKEEFEKFNDLIRTIEERQLRIKVVSTRTSAGDLLDGPCIVVGQPQIRLDLRELIRDRLHNSDSMYGGIKRLTKHTKQKLARKLEGHADSLLYAEQMLRFLGTFQRETAINTVLDGPMPSDVAEIYDLMLQRAQSKIKQEYLPGMKLVVTWAVFAFRPLSLKEIGQIAGTIPLDEGIAEDIMSERLKSFFDTTYTDGLNAQIPIDSDILFDEALTLAHLGDDKLQLELRDESMKSFFGGGVEDMALRTTESYGHYRIFLTSFETMRDCDATKSSTLDNYVAQYCLKHWYKIQPSELPLAQQAIACTYFANLIKQGHWSKSLRNLPAAPSTSEILGEVDDFKEAWTRWSELAESLELDEDGLTYWRNGHANALWPLAKSLLCDWLGAWDAPRALKAYKLARDTIKYTEYRRLLDKSFDFDSNSLNDDTDSNTEAITTLVEVQGLAAAADLPESATSHFAVGAVLSDRNDHQSAIREHEISLEMSTGPQQRIRSQISIAFAFRRMEEWDQALQYCDAILSYSPEPSTKKDPDSRSDAAEETNGARDANVDPADSTYVVPPGYRSWALAMKAAALRRVERCAEAACCYRDARLCHPTIVPPVDLLNELKCHWWNDGDCTAIMDTLMHSFKPIERLNLLTSPSLMDDKEAVPSDLIQQAVAKTGRYGDMVKLYKEVIKTLDAEEAGAPLRYRLAATQVALNHDIPAAKVLLNQIFDSVHDSMEYKLSEEQVIDILMDSSDLMAQLLLSEFRSSPNAEDKVQIMLELKDIPNRSLSSCALVTPSTWHSVRLALARMLQKIGPASEYQAVMNQVFQQCLVNLRDSSDLNDAENVFILGKLLAMMPGTRLRTYAELVISAFKQDLSPPKSEKGTTEENEDESDEDWSKIYCNGHCLPAASFEPWDQNLYVCLFCPNAAICENCYQTRLDWNSRSKPDDEPDFCCDNGRYLKAPIEGYLGMENGVISVARKADHVSNGVGSEHEEDGAEKIEFTKLLKDIEIAWTKAWEDHWVGF